MSSTVVQTGLKQAVGEVIGERLKWAIVVAQTEDGWEVVCSSDENGEEFDILRTSQEFNLALKGLMYRELERLAAGEANKEETP